jgi:hypothetical protein
MNLEERERESAPIDSRDAVRKEEEESELANARTVLTHS